MSEKLNRILNEIIEMKKQITDMEQSLNERLNLHEKKLDIIMEQTARNAELESTVEELSAAVSANTTDIKLMKRILTNQ